MTGTKFGWGAAQCLSCAIIIDNPDGTSYTSPTCIVPAVSFNGKSIRTVKALQRRRAFRSAKGVHRAFLFQCGYCPAGLPQRGPGAAGTSGEAAGGACRALRKRLAKAFDSHLCRCTGYIKYHEAMRDVILADPGRSISWRRSMVIRIDPGCRVKILIAAAALLMSILTAYAVSDRGDRGSPSQRRRALPRSTTPRHDRRRCSPSSAKC